jgi:hypothetical protein
VTFHGRQRGSMTVCPKLCRVRRRHLPSLSARPDRNDIAKRTMKPLTLDQFKTQLAAMLREIPYGTSADLTDYAVAFWDGSKVVYAFLFEDDSGMIEDEFELGDYEWDRWHDDFVTWINEPMFSVRPEIHKRTWTASTDNGGR